MYTFIKQLLIAMMFLCTAKVFAAPSSCPNYPIPSDEFWSSIGEPKGNLTGVAYYEGGRFVICSYSNSFGFLQSKFRVNGITGDDWKRIIPCPLERSCYTCKKISDSSCHFQS